MSKEPSLYTREELIAAIEQITAELKGPMSNLERALLVADRKDARELLAKLEADREATP